jgi:hypothetical protein
MMGIAVDHYQLVRRYSVASLIAAGSTHLTKPATNSQRKLHYPVGDVARIFECFTKDISYSLLNTSSFGMSNCTYDWATAYSKSKPIWADVQLALNNDSVANKMTGGYDVRNYAHFGIREQERTMIPNSLIKPKSLMCEKCRRANINLDRTTYINSGVMTVPANFDDRIAFQDVAAHEMFRVPDAVGETLNKILKDGCADKIQICLAGLNLGPGMEREVPSLYDWSKKSLDQEFYPGFGFYRPYAAFLVAQTILADQIKVLQSSNEQDSIKKAAEMTQLRHYKTCFETIGKEVTGYTDIDLSKCNVTLMGHCPLRLIVDATEVALEDYSSEMDKIRRELGTDVRVCDTCSASSTRRAS